jgi:subtilisin-like proprotein convertase family protein
MDHEQVARGSTRVGAAAVALLLLALAAVVTARPAGAIVFSNSSTITIPSVGTTGVAFPYPSSITVSGLTGVVTDVNVTLNGLSHTFPADVDVLLVGPTGRTVVLMADSGSTNDVVGGVLTFDDSAAATLPATIVTGTFKPTNGGAFNGPAPAPAGPYGSALSAFNGTAPNGIWRLYVYDDLGGDTGSISTGWSVDISNAPTVSSFAPTSGAPGTSVVITGTNFIGATAVRFGGVAATTFTENSTTQITATVPIGAITGPISVTTATGTGTSAASFTVSALAPSITLLDPGSGKVGDVITINGANLSGATSVKFNGVAATTFSVASAAQIVATVPAGATTGPVSVTTPGGTGNSSTAFVVKHARSVTLSLPGSSAEGTVTVLDGFSACASAVPVKIQHRVGPHWRTIGTATTAAGGSYTLGGAAASGRYRAIAKLVTLVTGDVCLKDRSPVETT